MLVVIQILFLGQWRSLNLVGII
uniref:Uncharacterized protein n=1 Tax=Rhizophora mucronata TaxID=61149 RepID=A0A2P2IKT3_RHIMU